MVLRVDEKRQIQAPDRMQPRLPKGLGYLEGLSRDGVHRGTTPLFAALDIASGRVPARRAARHRHQEFLRFLNEIDTNVPANLDVHLVVDDYCTRTPQEVRQWLAARPRFHVRDTPTSASWLNQVAIWFNLITQRAILRGTFHRVKHPIGDIEAFVADHSPKSRPFIWTATAESIIDRIERLCSAIAGTRHPQSTAAAGVPAATEC